MVESEDSDGSERVIGSSSRVGDHRRIGKKVIRVEVMIGWGEDRIVG